MFYTYGDFKKAFDKVPHKRLLTKLKAYGITGKLLNWILCDWLWKNPPVTHKDNNLEKRN